jgi:NitT/TauT family transport system substrate-binding protein
MMIKKKHGLALAVAAAVLVAACVPGFALDKVKVGKSVNQNMLFAAIEVGQIGKIWESVGIETTSVALGGDAKVQQALTTNDVQFGLGGGPALGYRAKGIPVAGIAPIDTTPHLNIVVRPDSPLREPKDLKGKLVGVTTAGSLTDWLVREFSRKMGWGPTGMRIVPMGDPRARYAALKTGDIDSITMPTEAAYEFEIKNQGRIIVSFPDYVAKFHSLMIFTSDRLIKDNPDLVRRFIQGYFKTIAYMKDNKAPSARIISKVTGLSEEAILRAWDIEFSGLSDNGAFDPEALDVLRHSFQELGILDFVPEAKDIYVGTFVPAKF